MIFHKFAIKIININLIDIIDISKIIRVSY